jgi:hypothetical protein
MTIAMIWLHRILPTRERYSLPPREFIIHGREARAAVTDQSFRVGATAATIYGSKNSPKGW